MTLTEAAQAIAIRFDLTRDEWVELVDAVTTSIDMPGEKLPPMTAALARKLGVFTLREAVALVMAKRFGGPRPDPASCPDTAPEPDGPPEPVQPPPPMRVEHVVIRGREIVRKERACSFCRVPGHQQRTCPELGLAKKSKNREVWRGSAVARKG
jgi:hypothetical protein